VIFHDGAPFDERFEPEVNEAKDPLSVYKSKRKFNETPEPEGKKGGKNKYRFVIPRHIAEKAGEHFDLRLENDNGTLSSWSIPKHKLPEKSEKLLAIKTEDHPLEYRTFKGEIPSGYGAGKVEIHGSGTYNELQWGGTKIVFKLNGKKEKGTYKLFNTDGNRWMIMIEKEKEAMLQIFRRVAGLSV
jgi:bifunctional non-homologous end joining protein LigD